MRDKNKSKHTAEPWEYGDQSATVHGPAPEFLQVAHFMSEPGTCMQHDFEIVKANAKRAVACVNACAGINPEAISDFKEACEALDEAYRLGEEDGGSIEWENVDRAWEMAKAALKKSKSIKR